MLEACRARGLGEQDYPFNTHDQGLRSLSTYVRSLIDQDPVRFARAQFGVDAARSMRREPHRSRAERPKRALERLELDEHTIDLGVPLRLRLSDGTSKALPTSRIHLIAMHDVFCNAALGYYVSFRPQATAFDIQRCVVRALRSPMGAGVPEGAFSPGGDDSRCVPVDWLPDFQWCAWDELLLDRAWFPSRERHRRQLTAKIGSIARFDARRTPEQRGAIEALFKGIADEIHQLPGTTGSSPKDPLRYAHTGSEPLIYTDDVNDIVIRLIREHNLAVSRSRGNRAPFTVFEESLRVHGPPRTVPPNLRKVERVIGFRINATVRSQAQSGRRPYVQYKNVHYTNALLANHFGLTGKKLTLLINPDDLRSVEAFLPNGHELGLLTARWGCGVVYHTRWKTDLFFAGITPSERQALGSGKGAAVRDAMQRLSEKAQGGRRDAARLAAFHDTTSSHELDAPVKALQVIKRFLGCKFVFNGVRTSDELSKIIDSYDEDSRYPENSEWTFTRFYLPDAYEQGWRLREQADAVWQAAAELPKSAPRARSGYPWTSPQAWLNNFSSACEPAGLPCQRSFPRRQSGKFSRIWVT